MEAAPLRPSVRLNTVPVTVPPYFWPYLSLRSFIFIREKKPYHKIAGVFWSPLYCSFTLISRNSTNGFFANNGSSYMPSFICPSRCRSSPVIKVLSPWGQCFENSLMKRLCSFTVSRFLSPRWMEKCVLLSVRMNLKASLVHKESCLLDAQFLTFSFILSDSVCIYQS